MKIKTRKELYEYLDNADWNEKLDIPMSCVYFLVTYNGKTEATYFMPYDGSYFESECILCQNCEESELESYIDCYYNNKTKEIFDYEKSMCRGGYHYEIENFQNMPYLKEGELEEIEMISEQECLDWLLKEYGE